MHAPFEGAIFKRSHQIGNIHTYYIIIIRLLKKGKIGVFYPVGPFKSRHYGKKHENKKKLHPKYLTFDISLKLPDLTAWLILKVLIKFSAFESPCIPTPDTTLAWLKITSMYPLLSADFAHHVFGL